MDLSHTLPDELWVLDDEDEIHRYAVSVADYNVYEKDGKHCLCIYARAPKKLSPDELNPEPWIELNLKSAVRGHVELQGGSVLHMEAYDDEVGENLTSMYYFSHAGVENVKVHVIKALSDDSRILDIAGEGNGGDIRLRGTFTLNPVRFQSFS
jgi:hypothetical protein